MSDDKPKTTYDFLNQGIWWRNAQGAWMPVAEMSAEYRFNCARMLMARASRYAFAVEMEELRSISMFGAPDDVEPWTVGYPDSWMRERPIYRALTSDLPKGPKASARLAERARHYATCPLRLRRKLRPEGATCMCQLKEESS